MKRTRTANCCQLEEGYHERTLLRLAADIPSLLVRRVTEESRLRVDHIISPARVEWIMPTGDDMAKQLKKNTKSTPEIECNDPDLPVEVKFNTAAGRTETKKFANISDFSDWFDSDLHRVEASLAGKDVTQIEIEELGEPEGEPPAAVPEKRGKKAAGKKAAAAKPPVGRGAVVKPEEKVVKKPRGVNFVRHGVRVAGKDYRSAWDAFQQLKLGTANECIKFRTLLKASKGGKLTYEKGGKKYPFELVELK